MFVSLNGCSSGFTSFSSLPCSVFIASRRLCLPGLLSSCAARRIEFIVSSLYGSLMTLSPCCCFTLVSILFWRSVGRSDAYFTGISFYPCSLFSFGYALSFPLHFLFLCSFFSLLFLFRCCFFFLRCLYFPLLILFLFCFFSLNSCFFSLAVSFPLLFPFLCCFLSFAPFFSFVPFFSFAPFFSSALSLHLLPFPLMNLLSHSFLYLSLTSLILYSQSSSFPFTALSFPSLSSSFTFPHSLVLSISLSLSIFHIQLGRVGENERVALQSRIGSRLAQQSRLAASLPPHLYVRRRSTPPRRSLPLHQPPRLHPALFRTLSSILLQMDRQLAVRSRVVVSRS